MTYYGIGEAGFIRKRLDEIKTELHQDLSQGFGFDTSQNPKSYLNVLVTNFADKIAELWEVAEGVYYNMYPSSAEGLNLDQVAQYMGVVREQPSKSYYPLHCTGVDGTIIAKGTKVASSTNPAVNFIIKEQGEISRESFNKARIRAVAVNGGQIYSLELNENAISYTALENDLEVDILAGLRDLVNSSSAISSNFTALIDEEGFLSLNAKDLESNTKLVLSENLTTQEVSSILNFESEEYGEVILPNNTITKIITAVSGFNSCTNLGGYILGRLLETDAELRKAYLAKIYSLSSRMLESIVSSILTNVNGVESVKGYENCSHEEDSEGRYPHSIEIVVKGGLGNEIAQQILNQKAGGINTYGNTEINLVGEYGENIPIRFSRPTNLYCWFRVNINKFADESLPANYEEIISDIILKRVNALEIGEKITPQKYIASLYEKLPALYSIEIKMYANTDLEVSLPQKFTDLSYTPTSRELPRADNSRIAVILNE